MKEIILNHPMIKHKISILRNEKTGTKEFRELISEIAMLLCYEALKDAKTDTVEVKTPIAKKARQYLINNFGINVNAYDLIIGYRADDSYFDYADAFINNSITIEQLSRAMRLGKLGEQIVLKSEYAFTKIKYISSEIAEKDTYYVLRKERDIKANKAYFDILEEETKGLYIQNIIDGGITNDDKRIPRNIC